MKSNRSPLPLMAPRSSGLPHFPVLSPRFQSSALDRPRDRLGLSLARARRADPAPVFPTVGLREMPSGPSRSTTSPNIVEGHGEGGSLVRDRWRRAAHLSKAVRRIASVIRRRRPWCRGRCVSAARARAGSQIDHEGPGGHEGPMRDAPPRA